MNACLSTYSRLPLYWTYRSVMLAFLNAILATEGDEADPVSLPVRYAEVNSTQLPERLPQDILEIGHEPAGASSFNEQLASVLATKHAKPTAEKSNEATCGTSARLPQSTQLYGQSRHCDSC